MDYKETEGLISKYISNETGSHRSHSGNTVHRYFRLNDYSIDRVSAVLMENGFTTIPTGSSHTREFFSEKYLSNVTYCEGDFYIVQFESPQELHEQREKSIAWYKEN
jgi:hypothetical protein